MPFLRKRYLDQSSSPVRKFRNVKQTEFRSSDEFRQYSESGPPSIAANTFTDTVENEQTLIKKVLNFMLGKENSIDVDDVDSEIRKEREFRKDVRVRTAAVGIFRSDEMLSVRRSISEQIGSGRLALKPGLALHLNVNMSDMLVDILMGYNPSWLKLGLEIVLGEIITVPTSSQSIVLKSTMISRVLQCYIRDRVINDPEIKARYAPNTLVPSGEVEVRYSKVLGERTLDRVLSLVLFLDHAKGKEILEGSPCLFRKGMDIENASSNSVLKRFSKFLRGEGDILRHLGRLGYIVRHVQTDLDEFDFTFSDNLILELKDGIRLAKIAEIVTNSFAGSLLKTLMVPANSKLKEKYNVGKGLKFLFSCGFSGASRIIIKEEDFLDGTQKVLPFLWNLLAHYRLSALLDVEALKMESAKVALELHRKILHGDHLTLHESEPIPMNKLAVIDFQNHDEFCLFDWARTICHAYGVPLFNFSKSFCDGRAFCILIHHYFPSLMPLNLISKSTFHLPGDEDNIMHENWLDYLDWGKFSQDEYWLALEGERSNVKLFTRCAEALGGIPPMIPVFDSTRIPDEGAIITVLSFLASRLVEHSSEIRAVLRLQTLARNARKSSFVATSVSQAEMKTYAAPGIQTQPLPFSKPAVPVSAETITDVAQCKHKILHDTMTLKGNVEYSNASKLAKKNTLSTVTRRSSIKVNAAKWKSTDEIPNSRVWETKELPEQAHVIKQNRGEFAGQPGPINPPGVYEASRSQGYIEPFQHHQIPYAEVQVAPAYDVSIPTSRMPHDWTGLATGQVDLNQNSANNTHTSFNEISNAESERNRYSYVPNLPDKYDIQFDSQFDVLHSDANAYIRGVSSVPQSILKRGEQVTSVFPKSEIPIPMKNDYESAANNEYASPKFISTLHQIEEESFSDEEFEGLALQVAKFRVKKAMTWWANLVRLRKVMLPKESHYPKVSIRSNKSIDTELSQPISMKIESRQVNMPYTRAKISPVQDNLVSKHTLNHPSFEFIKSVAHPAAYSPAGPNGSLQFKPDQSRPISNMESLRVEKLYADTGMTLVQDSFISKHTYGPFSVHNTYSKIESKTSRLNNSSIAFQPNKAKAELLGNETLYPDTIVATNMEKSTPVLDTYGSISMSVNRQLEGHSSNVFTDSAAQFHADKAVGSQPAKVNASLHNFNASNLAAPMSTSMARVNSTAPQLSVYLKDDTTSEDDNFDCSIKYVAEASAYVMLKWWARWAKSRKFASAMNSQKKHMALKQWAVNSKKLAFFRHQNSEAKKSRTLCISALNRWTEQASFLAKQRKNHKLIQTYYKYKYMNHREKNTLKHWAALAKSQRIIEDLKRQKRDFLLQKWKLNTKKIMYFRHRNTHINRPVAMISMALKRWITVAPILRKNKLRKQAAIAIQRLVRGWKARQKYLYKKDFSNGLKRKCILYVQSWTRGHIVRSKANAKISLARVKIEAIGAIMSGRRDFSSKVPMAVNLDTIENGNRFCDKVDACRRYEIYSCSKRTSCSIAYSNAPTVLIQLIKTLDSSRLHKELIHSCLKTLINVAGWHRRYAIRCANAPSAMETLLQLLEDFYDCPEIFIVATRVINEYAKSKSDFASKLRKPEHLNRLAEIVLELKKLVCEESNMNDIDISSNATVSLKRLHDLIRVLRVKA